MRKEYDFSTAKRAKDVPHLAKLQEEAAQGKTRITIYIDNDVVSWFKAKAAEVGGNYQTMINQELKRIISDDKPLKELIREAIREELKNAA
jgi:uncharacterized protein (DUF4415 family)